MSVLVVDDDRTLADVLSEQISALGYRVASAYDADSALNLLAGGSFRVVLSDLHMGPCDGFALLEAIRSRWPDVAVLLMSAFPAPETRSRAAEAGALALLSKPFSMEELSEALNRCSARH